MKIYSNHLTKSDLYQCADIAGVLLDDIETIQRPRIAASGWNVWLNGSSPHAAQHGGKAATWNEWGEFIYALFQRDPHARIGIYNTEADFYAMTLDQRERARRNGNEATHSAPWLERMVDYE